MKKRANLRWSPQRRPWPLGRPRGHILKPWSWLRSLSPWPQSLQVFKKARFLAQISSIFLIILVKKENNQTKINLNC